jgi:PTS system galactitol-specific IIB component
VTKRVLVICGTGVATSTVVATRVREHCESEGIDVTVTQGKVMDLLSGAQVPDSVRVPVVAGLPFLTGVGVDQALADVVRELRG